MQERKEPTGHCSREVQVPSTPTANHNQEESVEDRRRHLSGWKFIFTLHLDNNNIKDNHFSSVSSLFCRSPRIIHGHMGGHASTTECDGL